jgi:hypothetical protein
MFPDSGVPPSDAKNSLPDVTTANCDKLWYSTSRCQPRFDPAAANAMLAELMNVIMKGEVTYQCLALDNIQLAIRYLIQRGETMYAQTTGATANYYEAYLNPSLTRYNYGLTLCIVPHVTNTGTCYLNVDGKGWAPIMRNDNVAAVAGDVRAWAPIIVSFWNNSWYLVGTGLTYSQLPVVPPMPDLPLMLTSDLYTWVRPDGNDSTGDGTANDPSKAFRTINGCWAKIGGLYIASPIYTIVIMLGIPGDYEGFVLTGYGGKVRIQGDPASRAGYRINTSPPQIDNAMSGFIVGMNSLELRGVNIVSTQYGDGSGVGLWGIVLSSANVTLNDCDFERHVDSSGSAFAWIRTNSLLQWVGTNNFRGNGRKLGYCFLVSYSQIAPASGQPFWLNFYDFSIQQSSWNLSDLSTGMMHSTTVGGSGVTGSRYYITSNSIMSAHGQTLPGSLPGSVANGGQYHP